MKREPVQSNRPGAVVVLVGRVNVGKSTLFNRLTRTRSALVADYPGLTRDRLVGHARWGQHHFILVDTGGFDESGHTLAGRVSEQSLAAAGEADAIRFRPALAGRTDVSIALEDCTGCGACIGTCPAGAITLFRPKVTNTPHKEKAA